MRKEIISIILFFCLVVAMTGGAEAATLNYSDSVPLQATEWGKNVTLPKFDPSLGTLDNITIYMKSYTETDLGYESSDTSPQTVTMNVTADILLNMTDGTNLISSALSINQSDYLIKDGIPDFGGTGGRNYTDLNDSTSDSVIIPPPNVLADFIGVGENINLSAHASSAWSATGAANILAYAYTDASVIVNITYTYTPYASIGDYVWHDMDADGVQDPGESGIPDVNVTLYNCSDVEIAETKTNASGGYNFTQLVPDDYCVEFELPSGYNFSPDNQTDEANDSDANPTTGKTECTTLDPDEDDMTWDAGMYQNASIGDRVWNDTNMDGIQDLGESNVSGVTVKLMNCTGSELASTLTDGNGWYSFTGLTPGDYKIHFILPTGYGFTQKDQGSDDTLDSDANPTTGMTDCTNLESNEHNMTFDAGLIPQLPQIDIEKYVSINDTSHWEDADNPDGDEAIVGLDTVYFKFNVTNTGNVQLTNIELTDTLYDVSGCTIIDPLDPDESFECIIGPLPALDAQVENTANVTGENNSQKVSDEDDANYIGVKISIDIEKYVSIDNNVSWMDADDPNGPEANETDDVYFKFNVTNTGNKTLTNINLSDNMYDVSGCTLTDPLDPGESFECEIGPLSTMGVGQWENTATATGDYRHATATDSDDANYIVKPEGPGTGTPGYWKNHPEAWPVEVITIGDFTYTKADAIYYMSQPEKGDKTYTMFRALVAAKLNVFAGNDDSCIADNISDADAWMVTHGPVNDSIKVKAGGKSSPWREGDVIYQRLDLYNNGGLCCAASRDTSDLSITKTVLDDTPIAGDTVVFTLTVQNMGPANATGVYVDDTLEFNLTFNSSDNCTATNQYVYCNIGDLLRYEMRTLTFSADVNSTISSLTEIENTANVYGSDTYEWEDGWECDRRLNNQHNVTITVTPLSPP